MSLLFGCINNSGIAVDFGDSIVTALSFLIYFSNKYGIVYLTSLRGGSKSCEPSPSWRWKGRSGRR